MKHFLDRHFELSQRNTTIGRELRGAVATFLTMAYILFVNPSILADAGIPTGPAVACTAAAAGICCLLMGIFANFPMALASGMGLNAFVAYAITKTVTDHGIAPAEEAWKVAMGVIVLNGLVILALVLTGLREAVLHAIPRDLRLAIGAGIGLFIAFLGLSKAGLVVQGQGVPVTYGSLHAPSAALALGGLLLTAALVVRGVRGALLLGILITSAAALLLGLTSLPSGWSAPSFEIAFQADIRRALNLHLVPVLFAVMMVDFFDTLGTATGIAEAAELVDEKGNIPRIRPILAIDSMSAAIGGLFGVSSVTSYIESASGVAEGARTGLHTVFVGLLFLACIFIAPVAGMVPAAATAPALILVGFLMMSQMTRVDFTDLEKAIPAFITLLTIPLTFSIAHGIGYGFITYVVIKMATLKFRDVPPLMYGVTLAFVAYFLWGEG